MADNKSPNFSSITEAESHYRHLEKMPVADILSHINKEDTIVPLAVGAIIPAIEALVQAIVDKMLSGGRLFYIGAGTSGRLGLVDASECPVTFGVPPGLVIGIIAGGDKAITKAVEFAEDNKEQGWKDLVAYHINYKDVVLGISASGATPYVISALEKCKANGILTGCICCNPGSPATVLADHPLTVVVGPEFITGSTRMKSGTAQKLVLNMISTAVMIQLGRVEDNRMVHMQLSNEKLLERGALMLMEALPVEDITLAKELLVKHGSVKKAINAFSE